MQVVARGPKSAPAVKDGLAQPDVQVLEGAAVCLNLLEKAGLSLQSVSASMRSVFENLTLEGWCVVRSRSPSLEA